MRDFIGCLGNALILPLMLYSFLIGLAVTLTAFNYYGLVDWLWLPSWLNSFFHVGEGWFFLWRFLFAFSIASSVGTAFVQLLAIPAALMKVITDDDHP